MSRKNARTAMPLVTAWVNELRGAFGTDLIDGLIAKATTEGLPMVWNQVLVKIGSLKSK